MKKRILLFCLSLLAPLFLLAKLPEIEATDVTRIFTEIMRSHVTYKQLSPVIMQGIVTNYFEELDPGKTYLTQEDIAPWTNLTPEQSERLIAAYKKSDFTVFEEIQGRMIEAIGRRNRLEKSINPDNIPKHVDINEFKDITWAANEADLLSRLEKIRRLQTDVVEKMDDDLNAKSLQFINKRRENFEEAYLTTDLNMRKKLMYSLILKASASSLDTHTNYFTPGEASQFLIGVQQRLFGIGVQLRDDLNGFVVMKILEGGPASKCGGTLKEKDRIVAVNHEPIVGMDITEAVEYIRGPEGSDAILTILRDKIDSNGTKSHDTLDVNIVRGEVVLKESRMETLIEPFGDGIIANIKLFSFYQDPQSSSASDIHEKIEALKKEHNLKGVILDLRYNTGGLLTQGVNVTGLFISKGIVLSIKDANGNLQHMRDIDGEMVWDGPLIVLTSRLSASAAEIVAQTLQDYGRAIVVGDTTSYGKGSFQITTFTGAETVNPKGEYKVTQGRYYTVSGKSPQLDGVVSDVVVPSSLSELEIGERFAKNPLASDHIGPQFEDTLSDIPIFQRSRIASFYLNNLEKKTDTYTQYVPLLKQNSEERLKSNKTYQRFLEEIKKKEDLNKEMVEAYDSNDLQLMEASSVLKDLIFLMDKNVPVKNAA